jgi:hypothetical protein
MNGFKAPARIQNMVPIGKLIARGKPEKPILCATPSAISGDLTGISADAPGTSESGHDRFGSRLRALRSYLAAVLAEIGANKLEREV